MAEPTRIVIVGGGIAGITVATGLGRRLGRSGAAQVTLVDRALSHVWKPMLHTFAAGTALPDRQKLSLLAQAKANHFRFRLGSLQAVDRAARQLTLAPFVAEGDGAALAPTQLGYDVLILALGSRANDFGTPGVAEHCATIDDLSDAEALHRRLRGQVLAALRSEASLRIAIVGGGATGVEFAAELKHAVDVIAGYGTGALREKLRLTLIESGPRLLAAFPDRVSRAAAATLADLAVDVRTGALVTGADAAGFTLKDGGRIEADIKVWAAGVRAPAVLARIEGLDRSRTGQLVVGDTLQATRDPAIFALGDCAACPQPGAGHPVPATAQAAHQQARHLVRHFEAWRRGGAMAPFRFRDKGALVSLADYNGWGTLGRYTFGGGRLRGLFARLAHDLLYRRHQVGLLGPFRGALAWLADDLAHAVGPPVRLD
ncbi:NAD(P)/FAD-dependent oxidoreductase [Methylobacterium sp. WL30]|uniref:NAD(P)/FAD-dependent oxidoreductase n=1 Tax=unclassified Methylobacterium TaxID=2615210 RepID=UPI0011C8A278|nr:MULTISPECIES: NAD(P)/FAD-dependent oxidoreductase [unclassified Methylobacterium]TXN41574.1 NAD(P)/FAD-dependent oxidoreductase [Methylobacterium sp. WL93]TXN49484.1 NAD(P)/FAD-dependent oxidoreductase [Methylobacterium sp. WL119]TXN68677.1 NAD(P)/FAD-dependent oxidoreductase [Methylobacterium sp. WL30]